MATTSGSRGGLGRGLGSLLANTSVEVPQQGNDSASALSQSGDVPGRFAELPIAAIAPNPRQPRDVFDPEALEELVHSIKEIGLLQPVVVRPVGEGRFELVAGERRLRASKIAGLATIPAIIRHTADADLLREALLENLHRANLNAIEEAAAYQQLLDDFSCTQEELATRIGRSRPQVTNTLRLLKLPASVQKRVAAGVLSAGHAKALGGVADAAVVDVLAVRVVAEGLSVRALEEIIAVGGVGGSARKKQRTVKPTSTDFPEVAEQLAHALDTRVTIQKPKGNKPGTIAIEFADAEDLARLAAQLRS